MFQFPGLAALTYVFSQDSPGYGGVSPFGNPRIILLPDTRGLSQVTTSFIASRCQGIHHTPLLAWSKN